MLIVIVITVMSVDQDDVIFIQIRLLCNIRMF